VRRSSSCPGRRSSRPGKYSVGRYVVSSCICKGLSSLSRALSGTSEQKDVLVQCSSVLRSFGTCSSVSSLRSGCSPSLSVSFLLIELPYISKSFLPAHDIVSSVATRSYAVASVGGFAFFGLDFGEKVSGAATEVWILRACIVQGSRQVSGFPCSGTGVMT